MRLQERADFVRQALWARYPDMKPHLNAKDPWQWLVATLLSAQCTDERVNKVTPIFFAKWPDSASLTQAEICDIEETIFSIGFYRNKAKHLRASAVLVEEEHGGEVPREMEKLISLPGVARKTANVVLWEGYGINAGLAVDTHVKRIAFRLGLSKHTRAEAVEKDLLKIFPKDTWGGINHRMVSFGRDVCRAKNPACDECELFSHCKQNGFSLKKKAV